STTVDPSSLSCDIATRHRHCSPTRRSSDLASPQRAVDERDEEERRHRGEDEAADHRPAERRVLLAALAEAQRHREGGEQNAPLRSEEHTSELQSRENLVCRLLLEKKKK